MKKLEKIIFGVLLIGIVSLSVLCFDIHNKNQELKKESEYWKVLAGVYEKLSEEYFDMIDWELGHVPDSQYRTEDRETTAYLFWWIPEDTDKYVTVSMTFTYDENGKPPMDRAWTAEEVKREYVHWVMDVKGQDFDGNDTWINLSDDYEFKWEDVLSWRNPYPYPIYFQWKGFTIIYLPR